MGLIPEWALGVGFIMIAIAAAQTVRSIVNRMIGAPPQAGSFMNRPADRLRAQRGPDVEGLQPTVDTLQTRLAEVEDRLDFAERRLAQQREAERLEPPRRGDA